MAAQTHPLHDRPYSKTPHALLADLYDLSQTIAADSTRAIDLVVQRALENVGGRFALFARFDGIGRQAIVQCGLNLPKGFRRAGGLAGRICDQALVRDAHPAVLIPDLGASAYTAADPDVKRYKLKACLGVPVCVDGTIIGGLMVFDDRPRDFSSDHVLMLKVMAQWVAHAAGRLLTERRMACKQVSDKLLSAISAKAISTRDDSFLDFCLQTVGRALKLDAACILWQDPESNRFRPHFSCWTLSGIAPAAADQSLDLRAFPIVREVLGRRRPFHSSDTSTLGDAFTAGFLNQQRISSLLLIPICHQQRAHGLFTMQMRQGARSWEDENMDTLMAIAAIIAQWKEGRSMSHALDESQALNDQMLQLSPTAIYRLDMRANKFIKVNDYMCAATGYSERELLSMNPEILLTPDSLAKFHERVLELQSGKSLSSQVDYEVITKSGRREWVRFHVRHLVEDGFIWGANVVAHFITEQKKNELELENYRKQLEALVRARTRELSLINQQLREEIIKGKETANELRLKTGRLEELNTAMRVLLDKRNEDRLRTEEHIRVNLAQLIEPYLDRLSNSGLSTMQKQVLDVIRMNISEVIGAPMPELSAKYYVFSPTELQVANLIRKGRATKEMARLLNLSPRTVESYRDSIRRKLGLKNKKVNLKTYLSTKE